ncbi:MAG: hypothetical protein KAG96_04875 [Ichthyobacteriaceae bacterium]|nr:hypothetical protein [Ichthyobacteriaceae bacterium]
MLSGIGQKFYMLWSALLLLLPIIIHVIWLSASLTTETSLEARNKFIGYSSILQFTTFWGMLSVFSSALAFMFAMRIVRAKEKYVIPGFLVLIASVYLLFVNIINFV